MTRPTPPEGHRITRRLPMIPPMLQAFLDCRKTNTRRVARGTVLDWLKGNKGFNPAFVADPANHLSPYGFPGDIIPVSEAIHRGADGMVRYSLDDAPAGLPWRWKVSKLAAMYLPLDLVRHWAENTATSLEHLQEISEADARAEGIEQVTSIGPLRAMGWKDYTGGPGFMYARPSFETLWDSINGQRPRCTWPDNPWVWRYGIRPLKAVEAKA